MSTEITVAFRGATLFLVEHQQQPYVPMKPVVEGMGLAWQSQHEKLKSNPRWGITEIVIPSIGGPQGASCLPLRKLPGWMNSIHPAKVRPEIRDTVIAFQDECDDILWDAWQKRMGAPTVEPPTPISPSPPRLTYATLEQRAPLVNAVRRLVKVAESKGRTLSYSDAHSIVNLKLGVEDIEHLSPEQIPQAMRLVGEILQTIVLEGEYIPRGEPEPIQSTPEYLTPQQEQTLSHCAYLVSHQMPAPRSVAHAYWYRLRKVTGVPSPGKFEVRHLPLLAQEVRRFYAVIEAYREVEYQATKTITKRLLRTDGEAAPLLAEIAREFEQASKETDAALQAKIQPWMMSQIGQLATPRLEG